MGVVLEWSGGKDQVTLGDPRIIRKPCMARPIRFAMWIMSSIEYYT